MNSVTLRRPDFACKLEFANEFNVMVPSSI